MACNYPRLDNTSNKPYPCGKCPDCLLRRSNSWAFRVMKEVECSDSVLWIRISYDDYHLNVTPNGHYTLSKVDFQLFMKRFRKAHTTEYAINKYGYGKPIKYFMCGEYGSRFHRPHYHVVLLNSREEFLAQSWRDDEGCTIGDIWIDDRPLTPDAVSYTCGYSFKKREVGGRFKDDRLPEFHLMSKGMGLSYLTPSMIDWHLADYTRNYVVLPGGVKTALPRYYADRLYNGWDVAKRLPIKEVREVSLDKSSSDKFWRYHADYVHRNGSADGFFRELGERRRAAIVNFQNKHKSRNDD